MIVQLAGETPFGQVGATSLLKVEPSSSCSAEASPGASANTALRVTKASGNRRIVSIEHHAASASCAMRCSSGRRRTRYEGIERLDLRDVHGLRALRTGLFLVRDLRAL